MIELKPNSLKLINKAEGMFLIGLKGNQEKLAEIMRSSSVHLSPLHSRFDQEKGHGRKDQRYYESYDISHINLHKRWNSVNFQTLIKVLRKQKNLKKGQPFYDCSYYLTNIKTKSIQDSDQLFNAIRNHWQVEVNNYIRDVVLKEDKIRISNTTSARVLACLRTLVIKLLGKHHITNKRTLIDHFAVRFDHCLDWLKSIRFL